MMPQTERLNEVLIFFYTTYHPRETDNLKKNRKCRFCSSDVDWMEADLNSSLWWIVRKRRGLCRLYDWRSLTCITRDKSDVSPGDPI